MKQTSLQDMLKALPAEQQDLAALLQHIARACIQIGREVRRGALIGVMGSVGRENVQGETQKKLDVIADGIFLDALRASAVVAGAVSEELEDAQALAPDGHYVVLFDPLDGSSNVDLDMTVGSIFSVLPYARKGMAELTDYLQPGTQQLCGGYALYGSSTMLVFSIGNGVQGFTLNEETDDFLLTHPDMKIPADTQEFAINVANQRFWQAPVRRYIDECLEGKEGVRGKDFNMRWVSSMCAEVHRLLIRGGVFMYPLDSKNAANGGRLRLLYEANPMSLLIEQAGGASIIGSERLLDVQPETIHQRIPVILGSLHEVERIRDYHRAIMD